MRVQQKLNGRRSYWSWLLVLALAACSGGGSGNLGSPEVPGAPTGMGAVGAPNQASGPMPMPAPPTLSREPETGGYVACKKLNGPEAECFGNELSAKPNESLRLTVYPFGYSASRWKLESLLWGTAHAAGYSTTIVADGTGAWSARVPANSGEVVEICWLEGTVCYYRVTVSIGIIGQESSWGPSNRMKNLVIDPDGGSLHSRKNTKRGWFDWLIPSAHAESGEEAEAVPSYYYEAHIGSYGITQSRATCDGAVGEFLLKNKGGASIYHRGSGSGSAIAVRIQGGTQDDISDIQTFTDPTTGQKRFVIAVNNLVQVFKPEGTSYTIAHSIEHPFHIAKILDLGASFLAIPRMSAFDMDTGLPHVERPPFYLIPKTAGGGSVYTSRCLFMGSSVLQGVHRVLNGDSHDKAFAFVAVYGESDFRLIAGKGGEGANAFYLPPFLVKKFTGPVQVRILKSSATHLHLAVLDSGAKKLIYYQFTLDSNPIGQRMIETPLADLRVGAERLSLGEPTVFAVDRVNHEIAFANVRQSSWELVRVPHQFRDFQIYPGQLATVHVMGRQLPSVLARDERNRRWVYNSGGYEIQYFSNLTAATAVTGDTSDSNLIVFPIEWDATDLVFPTRENSDSED